MTASARTATGRAVINRAGVARMLVTGSVISPKPTRARRRRLSTATHRMLSFLAVLALTFLTAGPLRADERTDAGLFVADLTENIIQGVIEPELNEQERADRLRAVLTETLAVETIGRFVLGRYWITATQSERTAFLDIFVDVMVVRFMPMLATYSGERIEVGQVRSDPDRGVLFSVASRLIQPQGEPVNVTWRVRRDGDVYRVIDVVAEGVSMAISLRSEYRSYILQRGGRVAALISALRERVATDAATNTDG